MLPKAINLSFVGQSAQSSAVLHALPPHALVPLAVWPGESPVAMLEVVLILPPVRLAIWPREHTMPVHFVAEPTPTVTASITPSVLTRSCDMVFSEVS